MNKMLFSALAAAAVFSGSLFTASARPAASTMAGETTMTAAMPKDPAAPPMSGVATAPAAAVRIAAVVCGNVGCVPVQTKVVHRRKVQWLGHG